jgi:hypothetical protein
MLHFWRFRFAFQEDTIVLVDNPSSVLHINEDHNTKRATRFIEALKMFGCEDLVGVFGTLLRRYYQESSSYKHWVNALSRQF